MGLLNAGKGSKSLSAAMMPHPRFRLEIGDGDLRGEKRNNVVGVILP
jgi:hypothetical protein